MCNKRIIVILTSAFLSVIPPNLFAESALERELKQLKGEHEGELAAVAEPVNRRYRTSLEQLLHRATQSNDLDAAIKIKEALQAVEGSPTAGAIANPTGRWAWTSGRVITIQGNGTFSVDRGGGGKWRWTKPAKGEFTMIWDEGDYVDKLVISSDGTNISGSNNKGDRVNVTRLK